MLTDGKGGERYVLSSGIDYSRFRSELRSALVAARNTDGGWGYAPGRRSRIEPTCWAILALAHSEGRAPDVESLRTWKRQDGWLVDVPEAPPNNAFNAFAALTLLQQPSAASLARPLVKLLELEREGKVSVRRPPAELLEPVRASPIKTEEVSDPFLDML